MHDFGRMPARRLAAVLQQHGIATGQLAIPKAIEGAGDYRHVSDRMLEEISNAFARCHVGIGVLGCYVEPSLLDEGQRRAQMEIFKAGIRCAAALHAGCIATETTPFAREESDRPKTFDMLCRSVEEMLNAARTHRVTVAVEPVFTHTMNSPELTARLLEKFGGEDLGVVFDAVNLLSPDRIHRQESWWKECLEAFGQAIIGCHVKDVHFSKGVFTPCLLGQGLVQYGTIASWLRRHKPHVPVIREEISPATADADLAFMRRVFLGADPIRLAGQSAEPGRGQANPC